MCWGPISIGAVLTARSLDVYTRALPLCYTPLLFRNDLREHVCGVGQDDLVLALLRDLHVDTLRSHSPPGSD